MRKEINKTELELLTVQELGKILKLGRTALYEAMKRGLLPPAIRIGAGGQWRWRRNTVEKWLLDNEELPNASQKKKKKSREVNREAAENVTNRRRGRLSKAEEVKRRSFGQR
jgi:excisionase family DNA binding protein